MRIVFTGDNHVFHPLVTKKQVNDLMQDIKGQNPDVVVNAGDIAEVMMTWGNDELSKKMMWVKELFSFPTTLWVPGNHDLYSERKCTPPIAIEKCLELFEWGTCLQQKWTDTNTYFEKDGVLFLGCIGFPDFSLPSLIMGGKYYDQGCPTVDGKHMDLTGGWLQYSVPLIDAFEKKLLMIDSSPCKNVVVITHYPCFIGQYYPNPMDEISAYFFCHRIGEMIRHAAEKNSSKQFHCIAAHGHKYNRGKWFLESENLNTHGFIADYGLQKFITLDL